jgi:hypothetical protein
MTKKQLNSSLKGLTAPTYPITEAIERPIWLDEHKLKRGQKFANDHRYAIAICDIVSLLFLFSCKEGLQTLIFTGQSGCIFSSFKRYLSTISRVTSWYQHDLFDPSSKAARNLAIVRHMHSNVTKNMTSLTPTEVKERAKIDRPLSRVLKSLKLDLAQVKCNASDNSALKMKVNVYLNQWQMGFTQFG